MKAKLPVFIFSILSVFLISGVRTDGAEAAVKYVKWNAAGTNNGSSWDNAYTSLQSALSAAVAGSGDQIWVAAGTYSPGGATSSTFALKNGVALYGGFAGGETTLPERNIAANVTILSGNNVCYHVVTGSNTDNTAVLDGFTVTLGNAWTDGGGMYNFKGSPTVANVIFSQNTAQYGKGGGMYNYNGSPIVMNVTFSQNHAAHSGGGMYNEGDNGNGNGSASPTLTNVAFIGNTSSNLGGGMSNYAYPLGTYGESSPHLTNVTFSGNTATNNGGGMYSASDYSGAYTSPVLKNVTFSGNSAYNGGGMYNEGYQGGVSNASLTNVTFSQNTAAWGGGMYNSGSPNPIYPVLTNVTFKGNTATADSNPNNGKGIYNYYSNTKLYSCIVWDGTYDISNSSSTPTISYSIVYGSSPDPLLGTLGNYGGFTQTIPLLAGSPAINAVPAGTNGCGTTVAEDQRGGTRPQGADCDMGAYEFFPATTIALISSSNPSSFGGEVILTATITDSEAASTPTGTITFKDGGAAIPSCTDVTVSSGVAGCTLSSLGPGAHTITAEYSTNSSFSGSTSDSLIQTVLGADQTITVTASAPSGAQYNSSFQVTATATSGLDVSITTSGSCSGSGTGSATITMTASTGTCTVHYNQAGLGGYNAAPEITETVSAQKTDQTITVSTHALASALFNTAFNVVASSTSGLDVSITTSGSCSGSGAGTAEITMAGGSATCSVYFNQAGNDNYNAASQVAESTTLVLGLTVTLTGTGNGSVSSTSINCSWDGTGPQTGSCSLTSGYDTGSFDITASAGACSFFNTWNTLCTGNGAACGVAMTEDRTVGARFDLYPLAWSGSYLTGGYPTLSEVYSNAGSGALYVQEHTFTEDLVFDRGIDVVFDSGWNCDYTQQSGGVTVKSLTVSQGSACINNGSVIIWAAP